MERNEIEEAVDKSSCYITSSSGYQLYSKYWFPVGHPRALVFIAHGFAEHCMCFDDLAKTLACHELLVFSHDHVGHGRSEGPRTLIGSIDDCVQDVLHHVDLVKVMYPGCPVFLLGNSMGGTICIKSGLMRPKEFTGIVLIAAAISMNTEGITPLKCFLANLLGRLLPHFPISSIDQDLVVRSEEAKQIIANDPYHYNGFVKAGWAKTMLETLRELPSCVKNVDFPVLILHGGSDKVCDVSGAKMLFDSAKSKDKSLKVYPHSYHSLLREPDGISDQVITDVIDWMELRIG